MASVPADEVEARPGERPLVFRHRLSTRLWHWLNAATVVIMLMSGLMIFNAHPRLYWGAAGANFDFAWLEISAGHLRIGHWIIATHGLLGVQSGAGFTIAFPSAVTIPSQYDLAGARHWHFFFAWLLVVLGLGYWLWSSANRHVQRDLWPEARELKPATLWHDIRQHVLLRFPTGDAARRYNILQKISYIGVLFVLLPILVLTGLTMSPTMDAAWPWLLALFGGRQSARSIHFLCAMLIALFILVHVVMVLLAGPLNELRSMLTGWYRLPADREDLA